jgi:hypothetical protein
VVEGLLDGHLEPHRTRIALSGAEKKTQFAGERASAAVVLKRDLAPLEAKMRRRFRV